ncbi:Cyclic nucleotide-binding domain-containing protein, partial [Marinilabilia salmonicolor]|uniref:Crp/Fnr family transcriptional regulator n=1 Tax=Marinilabilia salmonicolor TaxID=989 RepID=UPI000D08056E
MKQKNVKSTSWEIFSPYFKQIEVPAKTLLLQEGKVSKTMYFIEQGCLRTWINNDGKEITTQFFFEGQIVSSIESFRTNQPSLYSIESLEPCILQTVSQNEFQDAIENLPELRKALEEHLFQRLLQGQKLFLSVSTPAKPYSWSNFLSINCGKSSLKFSAGVMW